MKKEKENKCWACGINLDEIKDIPSCKPDHYKLFLKSIAGETIEQLLERLPEAKRYL